MIIKEEDDTTEELIDYCDNEPESIVWDTRNISCNQIDESNEKCNSLDNCSPNNSSKSKKVEAPKRTRRKKGEPQKKLEKVFQCEQCDYKCERECKKILVICYTLCRFFLSNIQINFRSLTKTSENS